MTTQILTDNMDTPDSFNTTIRHFLIQPEDLTNGVRCRLLKSKNLSLRGCRKITHGHASHLKNLLGWLSKATPTRLNRQWLINNDELLTHEGIVFVKDLVDGLI